MREQTDYQMYAVPNMPATFKKKIVNSNGGMRTLDYEAGNLNSSYP